jgi:hypothetical protein
VFALHGVQAGVQRVVEVDGAGKVLRVPVLSTAAAAISAARSAGEPTMKVHGDLEHRRMVRGHRAFDQVHELAHVARPRVAHQPGERVGST